MNSRVLFACLFLSISNAIFLWVFAGDLMSAYDRFLRLFGLFTGRWEVIHLVIVLSFGILPILSWVIWKRKCDQGVMGYIQIFAGLSFVPLFLFFGLSFVYIVYFRSENQLFPEFYRTDSQPLVWNIFSIISVYLPFVVLYSIARRKKKSFSVIDE